MNTILYNFCWKTLDKVNSYLKFDFILYLIRNDYEKEQCILKFSRIFT